MASDDMLRRVLRDAKREWDMQEAMSPEEVDRMLKVVFHGSEVAYNAYMTQRLLHHLMTILGLAERSDFMILDPAPQNTGA
jgi:hypothetical protein